MGLVLVLLIGLVVGAALAQAKPALQTPTTGACCTADGACMQMTRLECHIPGGTYHGDGTSCAEATCDDMPVGACCLDDGSCAFRTEASCTAVGGEYNGAGADCAQATCTPQGDRTDGATTPLQVAKGSCCLPGDVCADDMTEGECRSLNGSYNGDLTLCGEAIDCGDKGACCTGDGSCLDITGDACDYLQGAFQDVESTCLETSCPSTGACCKHPGEGEPCEKMTQDECDITEVGIYLGDNSDCSACVTGACCLGQGDGMCGEYHPAYCQFLGGYYHGDGTTCESYPCLLPTGACCYSSLGDNGPSFTALDNGYIDACAIRTEFWCNTAFVEEDGTVIKGVGVYKGDDTTCTPNPCLATGACCKGGFCFPYTEAGCNLFGGDYKGDGTDCGENDCTETGACCDPIKGNCSQATINNCTAGGGIYKGDGTTCDPLNPCLTGACCFDDGCQDDYSLVACAFDNGIFQNYGTECASVSCKKGACCAGDGTCLEVTPAFCPVPEMIYYGEGSTCNDVNCPQPEGACCKPNGLCEEATTASCLAAGGAFHLGEDCGPPITPCPPPPPTGACCNDLGICMEVAQVSCIPGTYQGDDTTCDPDPCPPPPTGACCLGVLDNYECEKNKTALECDALFGAYAGDDVPCDQIDCTPLTGACCLGPPGYGCVDDMESACNGDYRGDGSACASVDCKPLKLVKTAYPNPLLEPGGDVTYTVTIENTGSETVTLSVLVDLVDSQTSDLNGVGNCSLPVIIDPSSSYICSFKANVGGDAGKTVLNTVTAEGMDALSNQVSASGSVTVGIVSGIDYGDSLYPDPSRKYPTLLAPDNGARHGLVEGGVYLGNCVDGEGDGLPTLDADGDDQTSGGPVYGTCADDNDDNGVTFMAPLILGKMADIVVVASADCTLSAWIDLNANGDWSDPGEELFPGGQALTARANNLSFLVPSDALPGDTHARFRCTTHGLAGFAGGALDGEVEDYKVPIYAMDSDGVPAAEESGPNQDDPFYDGNNDGVPDQVQSNVASLHTYDGQFYVFLTTSEGYLQDVKTVDNPSPGDAPAGMVFPYGFFEFQVSGIISGGAFSLILSLPEGMSVETYWKYGPTLGEPTPHWYEFMYDGQTGAEIDGNIITLHFVDGLRGDDDLKADGIVIDPSAPAGPPIGGYTALLKKTQRALWSRVALLVAAIGVVIGVGAAFGKRRK